jgi:hypothetical protein
MMTVPKNATREQKERFHEEVCNECAYWKDVVKRQEKAVAEGKRWKYLVCVPPNDRQTLQKFSQHITEWASR